MKIETRYYDGTIVNGQGFATANYRVVIPKIAESFPPVANSGLHGTINVVLDKSLDTRFADFWTERLLWTPVEGLRGLPRDEGFGLIRVKFGKQEFFDAWVILPEGHPWTYSGAGVEVVCVTRIPGILPKTRCRIELDHNPPKPRPWWYNVHLC